MIDKNNTFLKGIENLKATGSKKQLCIVTSAKIFLFYIYLCCFSKYRYASSDIFFVKGLSEAKKNNPADNCQKIYLRRFSNRPSELREKTSVVSLLTIRERFRIILHAIFSVPKGGNYLGRWLEFQILYEVFSKYNFKKICSFGHYDEFTFWLSELCESKDVQHIMYQHGVVMKSIKIPNKIYCNVIHVYNKYSKMVFEKEIVKNINCMFYVDGFKTDIMFKNLSRNNMKKYVGVVDQTFPEWLNYVTDAISSIDGIVSVVMLHPLTGSTSLETMDNIVVTREKYFNIDCLISD